MIWGVIIFCFCIAGGEDYSISNDQFIYIDPNNKQKEIMISIRDDNVVEPLIEEFYIVIIYIGDGQGDGDPYLSIGEDKKAKLQIRDDDSKR